MKKHIYLLIISIVCICNNSMQASSNQQPTKVTGHGNASFLPLRQTSRAIELYFAAIQH